MAQTKKKPNKPDQHHHHGDGCGCGHDHHNEKTVKRAGPKIGRNDKCPCGSDKKYKKCCGK